MFPVSGAEQLKTSGAMSERPMTSQSDAYSRLPSGTPVSPAPCQRFHKPCRRATSLSSSIIGKTADRKSVVEGKSVSVRVDLGGRSSSKKKKKTENEKTHGWSSMLKNEQTKQT